jgi:hypothetical protein
MRLGTKFLAEIPAGAQIRFHPSGDGWLVAQPDHPLKWYKFDGTSEVVKPPAGFPSPPSAS